VSFRPVARVLFPDVLFPDMARSETRGYSAWFAGSIHVAIEAGLVDLVALVGKAREQTRNLLVEGRAVLSSVQAHIYGGMFSTSIRRGVCGRHARQGRPGSRHCETAMYLVTPSGHTYAQGSRSVGRCSV
jgi:hypothetical protein